MCENVKYIKLCPICDVITTYYSYVMAVRTSVDFPTSHLQQTTDYTNKGLSKDCVFEIFQKSMEKKINSFP
jgi:hypothetical protein